MFSLKQIVAGVFTLMLVLSTVIVIPVDAGQRKVKGHQSSDRVTTAVRDPTPGVPTSPRGRGRYTNPGTRRGRYVRAGTIDTITSRRNSSPGTPRKRRVRRGYRQNQ